MVLVVIAAFLLDLWLGDPEYSYHPIRLMGRLIQKIETYLWKKGHHGRWGGVLLFGLTCFFSLGTWILVRRFIAPWGVVGSVLATCWDIYIVYSMLAFTDLLKSADKIEKAADTGDVSKARLAARCLAGRDLEPLDFKGLRRIGLESLAESFVDGILSPIFYLALFGIPGMIVFKVASTLDSMVGYQNEKYMHFGWFSARTDDWLNFIPARLAYICISFVAAVLPGFSARKALRVGWQQHKIVPGPNAGWSEATAAGALQKKLIGPIYKDGTLVTKVWLGDTIDPEGGDPGDIPKMIRLITLASVMAWLLAILWLI